MLPPVNSQLSAAKSKAQLLREYRTRHGRPQISESLLLRDALYLLQGISGKVVRFSENKTDGELTVVFSEDPVSDLFKVIPLSDDLKKRFLLPAPTRALILRLSELGHLYVRVSKWVRDHDGRPGVGMIEQAGQIYSAIR
jgi:gamma-tubulin complex component 3